MDRPTKEENRFLNYLEEYIVKLEKEKPNTIWKIDLPWFSVFGIHESIIISKSYGFIKRLVENDKIDMDKAYNGFITFHFHKWAWYRPDLVLLMILSIQENPINFLVNILR